MNNSTSWAQASNASVWQRYCGFLDLSVTEWQTIQDRLLEEQLDMISSRSPWKESFFRGFTITNPEEFRFTVPLTGYSDYHQFLEVGATELFPDEPVSWACTTTRGGSLKWIPFTRRALNQLSDTAMGVFLLAAARFREDVRIGPGSKVLYNLAPPPYLTGFVAEMLCERFNLRPLPPLEVGNTMGFHKRMESGLREATRTGVDVVCSLSSILIGIGEHLTSDKPTSRLDLHPSTLFRSTRGWLSSKLHQRPILPRDLWRPKAVVGWGLDTSLYRERIAYMWGQEPYEFEACTEAGILAVQGLTQQWLTPVPYTAYLEFLPIDRARLSSNDHESLATCLLSELEAGQRYELVITSFYGMPLLRYRTGHLVRVMAHEDGAAAVKLPQISHIGRCDDLIDLAGFTRLDEKTLAEAVSLCFNGYSHWTARKEFVNGQPVLHFYIEGQADGRSETLDQDLHERLKQLDPSYRDLEGMLRLKPIKVTLLSPGSFERYHFSTPEKQHLLKAPLPRINPRDDQFRALLQASSQV